MVDSKRWGERGPRQMPLGLPAQNYIRLFKMMYRPLLVKGKRQAQEPKKRSLSAYKNFVDYRAARKFAFKLDFAGRANIIILINSVK